MSSHERIKHILDEISSQSAQASGEFELLANLTTLKELSRVKEHSQAVYTSQGISTLCRYSFPDSESQKAWTYEALRCLANALTLDDHSVTLFFDCNGQTKLFSRLSRILLTSSTQSEFLVARILFLLTAKTGQSAAQKFSVYTQDLNSAVHFWLQRHAQLLDEEHSSQSAPDLTVLQDEAQALNESLKLAYNLATFIPAALAHVTPNPALNTNIEIADMCVGLLEKLYFQEATIMKPCMTHCINLLSSQSVGQALKTFPLILYKVLEDFTNVLLSDEHDWYGVIISEVQYAPLLAIFSNYCDCLNGNEMSIKSFASRLLVPASERSVPLGRSQSLAAKLLQLLNSATQVIRECIGTLLYQVSGSNASKFVENVGYGHAIGFLTSHGLAIPQEHIVTESGGESINPVTGQNLRDEEAEQAQKNLATMTDEEKEREAEKLFVLFQRLKKNGVIDVKDPIQQAVDEGRFQEM